MRTTTQAVQANDRGGITSKEADIRADYERGNLLKQRSTFINKDKQPSLMSTLLQGWKEVHRGGTNW